MCVRMYSWRIVVLFGCAPHISVHLYFDVLFFFYRQYEYTIGTPEIGIGWKRCTNECGNPSTPPPPPRPRAAKCTCKCKCTYLFSLLLSSRRTLNPTMRTRVEEITDPYGPPVAEEAYDAIAVSSETVSGAERINELRAQKGFRPLAVAVTRRLSAATLSSSFLRKMADKQNGHKATTTSGGKKRSSGRKKSPHRS